MSPLKDGKKILIFLNYALHLITEQVKKISNNSKIMGLAGTVARKEAFC
jgi:ATP-dependent protease HslVU (ClpYQ) peptidase subunit